MVIPVLVWSKAKTKLSELQRQKPTVHPLEKEVEEGNHVAYMSEDESKKCSNQFNSLNQSWMKIKKNH